jgi:hypothetical protein
VIHSDGIGGTERPPGESSREVVVRGRVGGVASAIG